MQTTSNIGSTCGDAVLRYSFTFGFCVAGKTLYYRAQFHQMDNFRSSTIMGRFKICCTSIYYALRAAIVLHTLHVCPFVFLWCFYGVILKLPVKPALGFSFLLTLHYSLNCSLVIWKPLTVQPSFFYTSAFPIDMGQVCKYQIFTCFAVSISVNLHFRS